MKKLIIIFSIFLSFVIYAQDINISFLNSARFGTGKALIDETMMERKHFEYIENLSELRIFKNYLNLGLRYQYDNPPEFGVNFIGIKKRFIEYNSEDIHLKAGNQSALFGKGLVLNLFENRNLGYDSEMDGVSAQYQNQYIKSKILAGEINFLEPATIPFESKRYELYNIKAINLEITPFKNILLGSSYLWNKATTPDQLSPDNATKNFDVENYELYSRFNLKVINIFLNYAHKRTIFNRSDSSKGSAIYSSISHTGSGYGVTLEYKNYRYDVQSPLYSYSFRDTRMLSYINPPTLVKEHTYTLLTRKPYINDFNDEVGFQLDAFLSLTKNLNLNINFAFSSKHYSYELDDKLQIKQKEIGSPHLPSFDNSRKPFSEIFAELEYSFDDYISFIKLAFDRRKIIDYNFFLKENNVQEKIYYCVPLLIQVSLSDEWTLKASLENMWVKEFPLTEFHYDNLFYLQFSRSPELSFGGKIEYTNNPYEPENKKFYFLIDLSYRLLNDHLITLSYGDERGGQVCTNGICRQVYPFSGLRLSIINYFN